MVFSCKSCKLDTTIDTESFIEAIKASDGTRAIQNKCTNCCNNIFYTFFTTPIDRGMRSITTTITYDAFHRFVAEADIYLSMSGDLPTRLENVDRSGISLNETIRVQQKED